MSAAIRLVMLAVVITLVLAAFTWPSGRLAPRDVPIGVVGTGPAALVERDAFDVRLYDSEADARAAILDREIYAALAGRSALIATAASPAVAAAIRQAAPDARVIDLAPATRRDPRLATLSALALPLTLTGMVAALMAFFTGRSARERAGLIVAAGAIAGPVAALLTQTWLDALPGSWLAIAGVVGLAVVATGAAVSGLAAHLGHAGIGVGAALMILIANPWSGVATAPELLPPPTDMIGQLLPAGATGSLLRNVAFFDGAAAGEHLIVLGTWATAGFALLASAGRRHGAITEPAAAGA